MRKGFIFDSYKCVSCNACRAACTLENGWIVNPRTIYTYNSEAENSLPIINLSQACNHCETAICMDGCPTLALSREAVTGAIVLDEEKCIGCKYCQWNCPYDAPKFNNVNRTIIKCNLCYLILIDDGQPACTSACPTGALSFGQLPEKKSGIAYSWFPDKKLNPAVEFAGQMNNSTLQIIPNDTSDVFNPSQEKKEKTISAEMSLVLFSFFATLSVSGIISSFIRGMYPDKIILIPALILTGVISLFHLGQKLRSWKSVANLRSSPISREITAFIVFSILSILTVFVKIPALLIASSLTGLVLLILIDSVYVFSDRSRLVILHSGQTFISSLLIISFFCGLVIPFIFIAIIRIGLSIRNIYRNKSADAYFGIRFLRLVFLFVSGISLVFNISFPDIPVIVLFLSGELTDRILFYIDFNPMNISTMIEEQLNIDRDEKKRS